MAARAALAALVLLCTLAVQAQAQACARPGTVGECMACRSHCDCKSNFCLLEGVSEPFCVRSFRVDSLGRCKKGTKTVTTTASGFGFGSGFASGSSGSSASASASASMRRRASGASGNGASASGFGFAASGNNAGTGRGSAGSSTGGGVGFGSGGGSAGFAGAMASPPARAKPSTPAAEASASVVVSTGCKRCRAGSDCRVGSEDYDHRCVNEICVRSLTSSAVAKCNIVAPASTRGAAKLCAGCVRGSDCASGVCINSKCRKAATYAGLQC